jgi:hypothetical protein
LFCLLQGPRVYQKWGVIKGKYIVDENVVNVVLPEMAYLTVESMLPVMI